MKKVQRSELLDLGAYEQIRERFRARIMEAKKHRRLSVGPAMTFIWENRDTVLFQVQEMLRTERITSESAIAHELDTYNDLVPAQGQLFATLMIEYTDPAERKIMLDKLASLRGEVTLRIGERSVPGAFHDQDGEEPDRLPAVNYVSFDVGDAAAELEDDATEVVLQIRNPGYSHDAPMPKPMWRELARDLREP